jgi:hypothetical protein
MSDCAKCGYPIPAGQKVWMRRKSTKDKVPFCASCAREVRQAIGARQKQPAPLAPSPPPPRAGAIASPSFDSVQPPAAPYAATAAAQPNVVIPIGSILLLFLITLVGAPLLGGIVAFVAQYIYLILLFPFVAGAAGGFMVAQGVRWGKVRDATVAAIFGLLLGLFVYGSYRYIEYFLFRNDVRAEIVKEMEAEFGWADATVADEVFDEVLLEETGKTGFLGKVLFDAKIGMSVAYTRSASAALDGTDSGVNIGTTLTWVYWLFEVAVFAGVSSFMAMEAAKRPFCEYHDRWYKKEKSLGGVNPSQAENAIGLLNADDYAAFGKMLRPKTPVPGVEFFIERCPGCQESDPILTTKTVKRSSRGQVKRDDLAKQNITPAQSEQIFESISA